MLGSLRFRLPAFFLLGIMLAGLVAALISIRFFQNYNRARAVDELRAESVGIVRLYARQAGVEAVPNPEPIPPPGRRPGYLGPPLPRAPPLPKNPGPPPGGGATATRP